MPQIRPFCWTCRLRLSGWLNSHSGSPRTPGSAIRHFHLGSRPSARLPPPWTPPLASQRRGFSNERDVLSENAQYLDTDVLPAEEAEPELANLTQEQRHHLVRAKIGPEAVARHARRRFGERLPEGALKEDEYRVYQRLFGTPLAWSPEHEDAFADDAQDDALLRESPDGSLHEVEYRAAQGETELEDRLQDLEDASLAAVDPSLREDIRAALREDAEEEDDASPENHVELVRGGDVVSHGGAPGLRTHPFTLAARSGTVPSTIAIPHESMTRPVSTMLAEVSNRHLREAGERLLGGPGLPYSTGTPKISRTMAQRPIPLNPYQTKTSEIEADVFMAALMPGVYASVTSVLVESRRILGSKWLERLLLKDGGPSILDAGAGGAGIVAWREVLRAEWEKLREERGSEMGINPDQPAPLGKATVLTAAAPLRHRMSSMLDNTTFLPRLPDYVHIEPRPAGEPGTPHGRKQFDIIVAPHSLWSLPETWQRRQHVQNLWAMLNEKGGILVLIEKGVPRGFEVLADARQYLIDSLFQNDSEIAPSDEANVVDTDDSSDQASKARRSYHRHASPGSIIAPCTTHSKCPMYRVPGVSRQRKDYCRFSQRYHRPPYHQNILGAKSRNHEDVEFSYITVMRGKRPEEIGRVTLPEAGGAERARVQGAIANDRAFAGYEMGDSDLMLAGGQEVEAAVTASINSKAEAAVEAETGSDRESVLTTPSPATPPPHPLTLPRLILPPLKKPGHVLMDLCTPAGTLERWSITRSFDRQAYRDARKSAWGDLWALGAKSRTGRRVRMGKGLVADGREVQDKDDWDGSSAGVEETEAVALAKNTEKRDRKLRGREKARYRKRAERAAMKKMGQRKTHEDNGEADD